MVIKVVSRIPKEHVKYQFWPIETYDTLFCKFPKVSLILQIDNVLKFIYQPKNTVKKVLNSEGIMYTKPRLGPYSHWELNNGD